MNEVTLPPSPNWYFSTILACASNGTIAWGARNSIVIANAQDDKKLNYKIIDRAHTERINSVAFSPLTDSDSQLSLVTSADHHIVKVWNTSDLSLILKNTELNNNQKVIGVDWSKHNPNLICFITDDGILVTWDIKLDISQQINLTKLIGSKFAATCISCCPHDSNLVSVGSKGGLICIVDIRAGSKGNNKFYKLRGHNKDIVSLSWCPVPINIFQEKGTKEFLLASGAKDREIYLWKAGTDYRYEIKLTFSNAPLDPSHHKKKVSSSAGNFTAVCWLEPMTLLTSSPWGELLLWDLTGFDLKKKFISKLIHGDHSKGLFSIAGLREKSLASAGENATLENDNWRIKRNIKAIWTLSQDRQVICCSVDDDKPTMEYKVPTIGGFVYCMAACPIDTSQIAFGVGDNMIRLWNLSEPHKNSIDLQVLWEKIMGKVRALSWHPENESLLAFATDEGRVGVYDTNVKKPPTLYRQYHRHTIYRLGWGPAPNTNDYALYSCADYELVYYTIGKNNDNPKTVMQKDCTEFAWKPDFSLLALGFVDGSISFLRPDLTKVGESIHDLNKPVQCFAWHPESTISDTEFSPMKNYLAVATNGTTITIFDISGKINEKNESFEPFFKIVATLKGHSDKVVSLAWSPHLSGYLVSGSYDYSAQVWKVDTQEVIGSFIGHLGPVQCCMWSPSSHDLILTGSTDFTLQIWSVSKQGKSNAPHKTKTSTKGKRTKKKKAKEFDPFVEISSEAKETTIQQSVEEDSVLSSPHDSDDIKAGKKKKKKTTYFPKYAEINNDNVVWCTSIRKLLNVVDDNSNGDTLIPSCNGIKKESNTGNDETSQPDVFPLLLGNKKNFDEALDYEKNVLQQSGHYTIATEIDLWRGNLKKNLEEIKKKKRLNDFSIALAPSVSLEFWKELCEAYVVQLVSEEYYHRAANFLLCLDRVDEAIDVFVNAKIFKEAYALASSRLDSGNPIIEKILVEWADSAHKDGHFQNATECYIKLKEYAKAAKVLERRKDLESLIVAIDVAEKSKDASLITSVADKAVLEALVTSNIEVATSIITDYPVVQYREIEIEVFDILNEFFESLGDEMILTWLKGLSVNHLLDEMKSRFAKKTIQYSLLIQKDVFPELLNEKMVQVSVSHQFALAAIAEQEELHLKHIVTAFDIIMQYEKTERATREGKLPLMIKYFAILDNKENITRNYKNELGESLRAYMCHAVIDWYLKDDSVEIQKFEYVDLIVDMFKTCIQNLLNKDSVKFWTSEEDIRSLEMRCAEIMGQVSREVQPLKKRLNELRNERAQFIQQRVSSPNPMYGYDVAMKFISQIPDDIIKCKLNDLVMKTWQNATS